MLPCGSGPACPSREQRHRRRPGELVCLLWRILMLTSDPLTQGATDLIALLSIGKAKEGGDSKCVASAACCAQP